MNEERSMVVFALKGEDAGFKLGGARVITLSAPDALNLELEAALSEAGIVALPEALKAMVSKKNLSLCEKDGFPILYFYPSEKR